MSKRDQDGTSLTFKEESILRPIIKGRMKGIEQKKIKKKEPLRFDLIRQGGLKAYNKGIGSLESREFVTAHNLLKAWHCTHSTKN